MPGNVLRFKPQFLLARLTLKSPPVGLFRNPSRRLYHVTCGVGDQQGRRGRKWAGLRVWFWAGRRLRLKKELTSLFRSLRITHRHCRTPPQDVTHPCDVSPFLPPPTSPLPLAVASPISLWAASLYSRHKSRCKYAADVLLSRNVFQQQFSWRGIFSPPDQLVSTVVLVWHQMTHLLMLVAAEGGSQGPAMHRSEHTPTHTHTRTQLLMQVSLRRYKTCIQNKRLDTHTHTHTHTQETHRLTHNDTCTLSLSLSHTHRHAGRRNPSYEYESPADLIIRQSPTRDR